MNDVVGAGTDCGRVAQNCFRHFKEDYTSLKNKPRLGRSFVAEDEALLEMVEYKTGSGISRKITPASKTNQGQVDLHLRIMRPYLKWLNIKLVQTFQGRLHQSQKQTKVREIFCCRR